MHTSHNIVAILSSEDETLQLLYPVTTTVFAFVVVLFRMHCVVVFLLSAFHQNKPVEVWMTELETAMRASVKAALYDSTLEYIDVPRYV